MRDRESRDKDKDGRSDKDSKDKDGRDSRDSKDKAREREREPARDKDTRDNDKDGGVAAGSSRERTSSRSKR